MDRDLDAERGDSVADELARAADQLDAWADTAELMGDDHGAARWRAQATSRRLRAMARLDE